MSVIEVKSDNIPIRGSAASLQGGRPENQDDLGFCDTPLGFLAVVCDGMGGGPGGKTASFVAKSELIASVRKSSPGTSPRMALQKAVAQANESLERKMRENPSLVGMGSTIVALLVSRDSAFVAHAGDSRCYLLRGKKCVFRTQDHSLVAELVQKKALSEEEARVSPQSNVVTRSLGSSSNHVPEIEEVPYLRGDRFVICTDGVWGMMPHKQLLQKLMSGLNTQSLVEDLTKEIDGLGKAKGGNYDNFTMSVLEMGISSNMGVRIVKKRSFMALVSAIVLVGVIAVGAAMLLRHKERSVPLVSPAQDVLVSDENISNSPSSAADDAVSQGYQVVANAASEASNTASNERRPDSLAALLRDKIKEIKSRHDSSDDSGQDTHVVKQKPHGGEQPTHSENDGNVSSVAANHPEDAAEALVRLYDKALSVKDKDMKSAQKQMYSCRDDVLQVLSQMKATLKDKEICASIDGMARQASTDSFWFVTREPDKDGYHTPTPTAKKELGKEKERAERIMEKLKKQ